MLPDFYFTRVLASHWLGILRMSTVIHLVGAFGCLLSSRQIAADEVVTRVMAAWETRQKSIESFQYHGEVERIQYVDLNADEYSLFDSP